MRFLAALCIAALLAACAGGERPKVNREGPQRPDSAPAYTATDAPKLTLITVINNTTGAGGHSALLVSGSEQVIFDPAGSFRHSDIVKKGDVLYGVSPGWVQAFKSAHARNTHHVVSQDFDVTAAQAERALELVRGNGIVMGGFCTNATSRVMRAVPGFEDIAVTFYPRNLMEQAAGRADLLETDQYFEDDEGNVVDGIAPTDT